MTRDCLKQASLLARIEEDLQLASDDLQRVKNCFAGSLKLSLSAGGYTANFVLDGTAARVTLDNLTTTLAVALNDARQAFAAL